MGKKPLKVKHFEFDHTYTGDHKFRYWKLMEKLGFKLFPDSTEHPGAICRFIGMHDRGKRFYLEFVHVTQPDPHEDSGISLRTVGETPLAQVHKKLAKAGKLKTNFVHRNYNWKENDTDHLPGWNYLNFGKSCPKGMYLWVTEYDRKPGEKRPKLKKFNHPGGFTRIIAVEFTVRPQDLRFLENLFGGKVANGVELACGTLFHFRLGKQTSQSAVVVGVKDLDRINQRKHELRLSAYEGAPALRVPNKQKRSWDVLFVQD